MDPVEDNPRCLSTLDLQMTRAGDAQNTLGVFLVFFTLVFLMWLTLIVQSELRVFGLSAFNYTVYDKMLKEE